MRLKDRRTSLAALLLLSGCGPRGIPPTGPPTRVVSLNHASAADLRLPFYPNATVTAGATWLAYQHDQPVQQVWSATLHTPAPLDQVAAFYVERLSRSGSWHKIAAAEASPTALLLMWEAPDQQRWVRLRREGGTTVIVLGRCQEGTGG